MKFLPVLLSLALAAHAAPSDPGAAAINFLEKVRLRKLNLEPGGDTALTRQTADGKKRQIARQLERMARDLGSDPLELGSVKQDEEFAAVLVRKAGGFDPASLRVFPVALVRRGTEWAAAPVPASFENAGTGYVIALRKRLEALENWMLREQVVDLEKLRHQVAERMRGKIETSLPVAEWRAYSAAQVGERFLRACDQKDVPALLGLLGGLSAKLPADWTVRLKSAERLGTGEVNHPLGPLAAPTVLQVLAASGSEGFSIITLDPAGRGRKSPGPVIRTFPFTLSRGDDGGWRVDLPVMEADEEPAAEDAGEFTALWALAHPPVAQPDAGQAKSAFLKALGTKTAEAALAISQPGNCLAAAQVWWDIHDPAAARHALPLAFQVDDDAAVCLLQFFSTREPEILDARPFYFEKTAAGWWWSPAPGETLRERFQPWVETETKRQSGEWQQALLADSPVLPTLKSAAPSEAEARRAVESWLDAARAADVPAALACTARLGEAGSAPTLLRNLGYEIAGFRNDGEEPAIVGVHQGKTWSVVVVRAVRDGGASHPIYPVVRTAVGPRILAEIDLSAAGSRSREFLNKVALDRLEKAGFVAAAEELAELLTACRADAVKQSGEVTK